MLVRAVLALVVAVVAGVDRPPAGGATDHTVTGLDPARVAVVDWALGLYAEAGLDLPPVDFVGHESVDACRGQAGYHVREGSRSIVHLCGAQRRRFAEVVTLHELAHAWDHEHLSDERRTAFLEQRGLAAWRADERTPWEQAGAEHAAEIVVWALRDRPMDVIQIPDTSCDQLLAGYLTLTGEPPLHGYTDRC